LLFRVTNPRWVWVVSPCGCQVTTAVRSRVRQTGAAVVLALVVFVSPVFDALVVVPTVVVPTVVVPLPPPAPAGALLGDVVVAGADVAVEGAPHAPRNTALAAIAGTAKSIGRIGSILRESGCGAAQSAAPVPCETPDLHGLARTNDVVKSVSGRRHRPGWGGSR
jgi:hypothetical protein